MTSRLSGAASPYLRSHAYQPVAWFPWGAEAFAAARSRDVPVFISIGYSTCHWCHVMARESFADPRVAEILNGSFVSIKVDREEHPEVDAAYLAQASAFTQNLGWPLNIFALPDGSAFHAGTYWPPTPHGQLQSFADVLQAVTRAWRDNPADVIAAGAAVSQALREMPAPDIVASVTSADIAAAARAILAREDGKHGGFGVSGAKFPMATALQFLLDPSLQENVPQARAVALTALGSMRRSELFDEVDGGFFRYATRPDWTIVHYERMLIDNAQLLDVALAAGDDDTATRIAVFLRDVMRKPSGGFGAAQDAESIIDGAPNEGGYYRLTRHERDLLAAPTVDAKIITAWNGVAIGALARLAARRGDADWLRVARAAAASVMTHNVAPNGAT